MKLLCLIDDLDILLMPNDSCTSVSLYGDREKMRIDASKMRRAVLNVTLTNCVSWKPSSIHLCFDTMRLYADIG